MEEKKHIDRLYQEKFKDFEAAPREVVWNNISSRLQEKKRKKSVFPLWYRIAGVAAILALFFNYASGLFKSSGNLTDRTAVATQEQRNFGELTLASGSYAENMLKSSIILQAIMQDTENKKVLEATKASSNSKVIREPAMGSVADTPLEIFLRPGVTTFSLLNALSYEELQQHSKTDKIISPETILLLTPEENLTEEDLDVVPAQEKRLRISTIAAPVFFDQTKGGNAIDARFANNSSEGELSMAYGVNIAYQISHRFKIRSGVTKVDLSYNTRDIAFTASVNPFPLAGIDYQGDIPKYRIENTAARPLSNISASTEFNRSSLASPATGYLNQRIGFIEVPVELEYSIIDKKIGLNIIGGGSTLFLDESMISLNSSNFSTDLGEANNLNSVSFSTNLGVGIDYKLSPQFQLNLEPMFKYQLNTYNNNPDFDTYYFGVYSGFSFRF